MKKFHIWYLQAIYMIISAGFLSLLYAYFVKSHISLWTIVLAEALGNLGAVLFIVYKREFDTQKNMRLGFSLLLCAFLSLLLPLSPLFLLIPYTVFKVTGSIMFFVPYNILFFEHTKKNKKLYAMTTYWAIALVVGIFAPISGGFLFLQFGLGFFVGIALLCLCGAFFLTTFVKKALYRYDLRTIFTHLKGLRTITMLDGALPTASGLLVTLLLLTFVQSEFNFGLTLSVIALISLFFTFPLAKFSDKYKKRFEFLWPLSCLAGFVMILFFGVQTFWSTLILILCFKFITTLLWPIESNIICDKKEMTPVTWISRELFLNIGRFLVLLFIVPIIYFGFLKEAFLLVGLLFIVFPFVVVQKGVYKN